MRWRWQLRLHRRYGRISLRSSDQRMYIHGSALRYRLSSMVKTLPWRASGHMKPSPPHSKLPRDICLSHSLPYWGGGCIFWTLNNSSTQSMTDFITQKSISVRGELTHHYQNTNHSLKTSKARFGRWTSGREYMCLNMCQLPVCSCRYPQSCVKCIASGHLATYQISAHSIQPFPRYEKESARACSCAPFFAKSLANGSLTL